MGPLSVNSIHIRVLLFEKKQKKLPAASALQEKSTTTCTTLAQPLCFFCLKGSLPRLKASGMSRAASLNLKQKQNAFYTDFVVVEKKKFFFCYFGLARFKASAGSALLFQQ